MLAPLDLSRLFEQHPVLETPRLILRELTPADAADMFEYHREPECVRYMPIAPSQSVADTEGWIKRIAVDYRAKLGINFGIELKAEKKVIG
jgi:ribosomal-protein-alanine N-acetyltransferase